jgi:hypothetical protein
MRTAAPAGPCAGAGRHARPVRARAQRGRCIAMEAAFPTRATPTTAAGVVLFATPPTGSCAPRGRAHARRARCSAAAAAWTFRLTTRIAVDVTTVAAPERPAKAGLASATAGCGATTRVPVPKVTRTTAAVAGSSAPQMPEHRSAMQGSVGSAARRRSLPAEARASTPRRIRSTAAPVLLSAPPGPIA